MHGDAYRVQSLSFQGPVYDDLIAPQQEDRMDSIPRHLLVEGPTGTGKSVGLGGFMKAYLRKNPGANCVVLRRIKADLGGSFMLMWENEILDPTDPWDLWMLDQGTGRIPSHRTREVYRYPNGSRLWCRGMDQWPRVKSMAYDVVWMMEGTEFEEQQLEGLATRIRARRGVVVPWRGLICDTNPEHPGHWLNQRALRGEIHRIKTTLRDNPGYFNLQTGEYTEPGDEYRQELFARLKGHNAARYIAGEWVAAEGQILEWDEDVSTFEGTVERKPGKRDRITFPRTHPVLGDFVELRGYAASYDWGIRHAGCMQVWGIGTDNRMYLIEEVYHSERPLHWWAEWAVTFTKKYDLKQIVCDNAAVDTISHFNREIQMQTDARGRIAIPCDKRSGNRQKNNLEVLQETFSSDVDGRPWVFFSKTALAHRPDPDLAIQRTIEEVPGYVYAPYDPGRHSGRPEERPDPSCVDDGLDALTYMRVYLLGGRGVADKVRPVDPSLNPREAMRKHYWERAKARA